MNILLVDDHQMMRDGLRMLLERADFRVVGEAATGQEALAAARALLPDVVVMDISMPGMNGIDATRRLLAELPQTKVVGLSMNADRRYAVALFDAGAQAYVVKNSASEELIHALHAVAAGNKYVSPAIGEMPTYGPDPLGSQASAIEPWSHKALSPREREVLQLVAEGKSSKDVATELGVAVSTVETHRRQIMDKLELRTIAELTKYAIREGLTSIG